jgi:D-arabinose 1-dehydrogenase-like Zn-dependent alcohol dehydrogenase
MSEGPSVDHQPRSANEMKALVYEAPEVMIMRRVPFPEPSSHEVVVRVAYSGICGSVHR